MYNYDSNNDKIVNTFSNFHGVKIHVNYTVHQQNDDSFGCEFPCSKLILLRFFLCLGKSVPQLIFTIFVSLLYFCVRCCCCQNWMWIYRNFCTNIYCIFLFFVSFYGLELPKNDRRFVCMSTLLFFFTSFFALFLFSAIV